MGCRHLSELGAGPGAWRALTSSPKVKLADGTEEEHKVISTRPAKDMAQVKNLVEYILAQTKK